MRQPSKDNQRRAVRREEWQRDMARAVPTDLVRAIANDFRRGPSLPSSMASRPGSSDDKPRAASIAVEAERGPPPGINYVDQLCAADDRRARAIAAQQRVETEWIETLLERRNPHRARHEYDVLKRYDDAVPAAHREKDE